MTKKVLLFFVLYIIRTLIKRIPNIDEFFFIYYLSLIADLSPILLYYS